MKNRRFNKKRIKKGMLAGVLALSVVISSTGSIVVNKTNTEAKRKKKNTKPKLILKGALKNKSVEIEEGETIKVNAVAKDKEDGNITKKIKIKVRNPENGEYEKRGKTIKFINDGTYKITVSVKDSKKAKASATRTIIVKENTENYGLATDRPVITNAPRPTSVVSAKPNITGIPKETRKPSISETPKVSARPSSMPEESIAPIITKNPTETPKETRKPNISETPKVSARPSSMPEESIAPIITKNPTETPKETRKPSISETPKVSAVPSSMPEGSIAPTPTKIPEIHLALPVLNDFSGYGIEQVKVGDVTYNITDNKDFADKFIWPIEYKEHHELVVDLKNDYERLYFPAEETSRVEQEYSFLKAIGELHSSDISGMDNSNNIIVWFSKQQMDKYIYFYARDAHGNQGLKIVHVYYKKNFNDLMDPNSEYCIGNYEIISEDPKCIGLKRIYYKSNTNTKTLKK